MPARIRSRLGLEKGDKVSFSLISKSVVVEEVDSYQEALEFIKSLPEINSFAYSDGVVEVVLDESQ